MDTNGAWSIHMNKVVGKCEEFGLGRTQASIVCRCVKSRHSFYHLPIWYLEFIHRDKNGDFTSFFSYMLKPWSGYPLVHCPDVILQETPSSFCGCGGGGNIVQRRIFSETHQIRHLSRQRRLRQDHRLCFRRSGQQEKKHSSCIFLIECLIPERSKL